MLGRGCARSVGSGALLALLLIAPAGGEPAPEVVSVQVFASGPSEVPFRAPRGIAFHRALGEVLVANSGLHRIEIFGLDGRRRGHFLRRVRTAAGDLEPGIPAALAIDPAGRLLVVDNRAPYVDVLDFRGRAVARLDLAAPGCPPGRRPAAVAVTPSGEILVAAAGSEGRIYRFDRDYHPLGCWGEAGLAPGRLADISGLATLPDGRVVVTCMRTQLAVQVFSPAGEYQTGFGVHDVGPGNFSLPSGVATTRDGRIWVTDEIRHVIQVFDATGRFLGMVGGGGAAPGQFLYPSALASDGGDWLAVTERVGNRFQLLRIRSAGATSMLTLSPKGR